MRFTGLTVAVSLAFTTSCASSGSQPQSSPPPTPAATVTPPSPTAPPASTTAPAVAGRGSGAAAPAQPGRGGGGGGGRGRGGAIQAMTLTPESWTSGGQIPVKHSQAGAELSPALSWTGAPATTQSFVLLVHNVNAPSQNQTGFDDALHWLVWNIPATATSLPEGISHGPQLPDGARQISVSGPYYRGPAAPATGPPHHYLFELFAVDTIIDVPPVGASAAATRAAVMTAMLGRVRGKAVAVGIFRRAAP